MSKNPFKQLATKLGGAAKNQAPSFNGYLEDVLDEHLDMIAAAHHSNHGSQHHSHPNRLEV